MERTYWYIVYSLLLSLILPATGTCQDSARTVVLSPRVGPVISLDDRDHFHIFQSIQTYQRATVFQAPDTTFYVRFMCSVQKDSSIEVRKSYSLQILLSIAEKINHYEGLLEGTYRMGTDPAQLRYAAGNASILVSAKELPGQPERDLADFLPHALLPPVTVDPEYPRFGISIGFSSFPVGLGSLSSLLESVRSYYRTLGYPIALGEPEDNPVAPLWLSIQLRLMPALSVNFEAATTMSEEQTAVRVGSLSVCYYPSLEFPEWFQPFLGVGVDVVKISLKGDLPSGSVISQTDQNGGYTTFDKVTFRGSHTSIAPSISGGVELGLDPSHTPAIRLIASYLAETKHPLDVGVVSVQSATAYHVTTGGFIMGIQLLIYL